MIIGGNLNMRETYSKIIVNTRAINPMRCKIEYIKASQVTDF